MMGIFSARLANSVSRTAFVVPCLLVCLACATPFPLDDLEEGMTAEAVREEFGEPVETHDIGEQEIWQYWHEEQYWPPTFHPLVPFLVPFVWLMPPQTWGEDHRRWDVMYVYRTPVLLRFEAEKLVLWEVTRVPSPWDRDD